MVPLLEPSPVRVKTAPLAATKIRGEGARVLHSRRRRWRVRRQGGNHGGDPRAEHAATKESEEAATQHHLTLLQPSVVEVSAAVLDKDKVAQHESVGLVGGSPPSGGRGRRRQRKSDGEEDDDTAVPGDLTTRAKRRQMTGSADNAGGAEVDTPRGAKEASGKAGGQALRQKGRPAARKASGGRRGKKAATGTRPKRGDEDPGESEEHEQFVTREEFQALRSEMYAMFAQLGLRRGVPASYAGGSAALPMAGTPPPMSAVDKARVLVLQETNPFPVCGGPNGAGWG
ncbi:unnamed protein product [Closterium sp. NIES-65]|nr:unnamed protein product [Closterium sp. NIES-65]